jgi:hypothetical protein
MRTNRPTLMCLSFSSTSALKPFSTTSSTCVHAVIAHSHETELGTHANTSCNEVFCRDVSFRERFQDFGVIVRVCRRKNQWSDNKPGRLVPAAYSK